MDSEAKDEGSSGGFYPPSASALNAGRILLFPDAGGEGNGGAGVAEPGAGPDGSQADAIRQAKESVFGKDDDGSAAGGEAAGVPAAAPASAKPSGAPASDASAWETAPLPANHPYAGKYKTLGELTRGYGESSGEAKRIAESLQNYRTLFQSLQKRGVIGNKGAAAPQAGSTTLGQAARVQEVPPVVPGAAPKDYYGHPSLEAWKAHYTQVMQSDPLRAVTDSFLQRAKHDAAFAKELQGVFAPVVEERLQPFVEESNQAKQRAEVQEVQHAGAAFFVKHPELNDPNNPVAKAMDEWMGKAGWHQADLETGEPGLVKAARTLKAYGLSPFEVAYNQVQAELLPLQLKASNTRLGEHRAKAETARPSGAGKTESLKRTPLEQARAIAADAGITDEASIQAMAEAMTERGVA